MGILLLAHPTNPPATIAPSESWDGTTSWGGRTIPTESGTVHGSGWTQQAIGNFDEAPYQWWDADFDVSVVAGTGDAEDIDHVEFWLEGSTATVSSRSVNARTGSVGFTVTVQPPAGTDGDAELYATIVPVNGYERLVGPIRMIFNKGASITRTVKTVKTSGGDYTSIVTAANAASDGWIIKVDAGTWTEDSTGTVGATLSRGYEVRPADGLSAGDVVVTRSSRASLRGFPRTIGIYRDIEFDTEACQVFYDGPNRVFIGCLFNDPNGINPGSRYRWNAAEAPTTFFRGNESQKTWAIDCEFNTLISSGAQFYRNCTINYSGDSITIRNEGVSHSNTTVLGVSANQNWGICALRMHDETSLTVATATYDGGTGRTTITLSGSPTLDDVAAPGDSDKSLYFLTGALAGQQFPLYSQTDATDTIVVTGDASSASASDTCWSGHGFHVDSLQWFGAAGTFTYENTVVQRYKAVGIEHQPFFMQTYPGTATILDTLFQLCIMDHQGDYPPYSQVQNAVTHWVVDQCTHVGCPVSIRDDSAGYATTDCVLRNSIFESVIVGSGGSLPSGLDFDANWFETGTQRGTNSGGGSSANLNATTYRPNSGSGVVGIAVSPVLQFDYYGDPFGDSLTAGAVAN